jgi:integrase
MELYEALKRAAGQQAPALAKYMRAAGISGWQDLDKSHLFDLRDAITEGVASSSAHTYFAVLKAFLGRYEEIEPICQEYRSILKARNAKPQKTYLNKKDLQKLEGVRTDTPQERLVLAQFLVGAYTGMRLSDIREATTCAIDGGTLTYTSIKTGIQATVPCSKKTAELIRIAQSEEATVTTAGFEKIIRRLCKRAGINERVTVVKAGRHMEGEKWRFISSHTARISFCTNLSRAGVPILDISKLAGHQSSVTTERYVVGSAPQLSKRAMAYFD